MDERSRACLSVPFDAVAEDLLDAVAEDLLDAVAEDL
jgi:hypothetical protein